MKIEDIQDWGVIGAGGAGFPTHVKLQAQSDTLIMNAAECEPLLHKDMEMLRHYSDVILTGFELARKLTGARHGIIGIKAKHHDVIELLKAKIKDSIGIIEIGDFYPAGDEILLVHLTTGRIVQPGQIPISVGCVVQNVETLYNIGRQKPVSDKFISVAGAVEKPATIKVPIGISFRDVLAQFKITVPHYAVRSGGLMMGELEYDLNQVITKRTGALIVLPVDHYCITTYQRYASEHNTDLMAKAACDQCNFCTEFCPRYLLGHPVRPEIAMRNRMFTREGADYVDLGSAFCCECNLCTLYACPESLDPKGATVIEKRVLQQRKKKWEGLPVSPHPMMEYRKVPTKKLMQRLDVLKYKDEGPLLNVPFKPDKVKIPLDKHIGTSAQPVVREGDRVNKDDLIGKANGKISTNIHASVDGRVAQITESEIIIERHK